VLGRWHAGGTHETRNRRFAPAETDARALEQLAVKELERILRSRKALNADKIRAAEQLRRYREEEKEEGGSELRAWVEALSLVPPQQRLALLRERLGLPPLVPAAPLG
jgi:hypothetical protein